VHSYWDLAQFAQSPSLNHRTEQAYFEQFDELLASVVRQQMVSDVPVGAFSSGGIDSSSVVYYASSHTPNPLKTFSIGFQEAGYSELTYAQQISDYLHTDHFQHVVRPMPLGSLSDLVWYYDEPLGDTSLIPTYFVSDLARQHVTVALSGDGGDELLAGYDTYVADRLQVPYSRIPGWLHERVVQPTVDSIPLTYRKVSLDYKIRKFVAHAYGTPEEAHYRWRSMFSPREIRSLVGLQATNDYTPFSTYARHYDAVPGASRLNKSLYVDIKTWLVDDILAKVDRASMASGLEVRVPFLSPRLVEHAMRLPARYKLRGFKSKYILKKVMGNRLPHRIIHRLKSGFNAPIAIWMRQSLRGEIDDLFRQRASNIVDLGSPLLVKMWGEHSTGQASHGYELWTLLSLILWEAQVLK
jgi:asparagine synthase (glutamine-hydrolysing)